MWPAGDWESLTGEDEKEDLALGDTKESPGDSRPICQDIGEVSGSFGSFGHCRVPRRSQYTVEDRRDISKRYRPNGYSVAISQSLYKTQSYRNTIFCSRAVFCAAAQILRGSALAAQSCSADCAGEFWMRILLFTVFQRAISLSPYNTP